MPRLAAWLDSYQQGLRDALQTAAAQGYRHVQANAAGAELNPADFTHSARRHLGKYLRDLGLELDAVALAFPGLGLADPRYADERVDRLRRTLELCADLGVRRAGVAIAGFADERRAGLARQVLPVVADLADRASVRVALDDEVDDPAQLADEVRVLGCPHVQLALDSARVDPAPEVLGRLGPLAGAVYLRDVRRTGDLLEEVRFGQGQVDFHGLLAGLDAGGFREAYVVRHAGATGGVDALRHGREYIASLIGGTPRR